MLVLKLEIRKQFIHVFQFYANYRNIFIFFYFFFCPMISVTITVPGEDLEEVYCFERRLSLKGGVHYGVEGVMEGEARDS